MKVILDIETDSLTPSKIWVLVVRFISDKERVEVFTSPPPSSFWNDIDEIIGHNIIKFDLPALRNLWNVNLSAKKITDTLALSHLLFYRIDNGHSLRAWGQRLGCDKDEFNDWSRLSQEMIDYCVKDTLVNLKLFDFLMSKIGKFEESHQLEMEVEQLCYEMSCNGFPFNINRALRVRDVLSSHVQDLDKDLFRLFLPQIIPLREETVLQTKSGSISKSKLKWYKGPIEHFSVGSSYTRILIKEFNPNSPKQVIDVLNKAGWKPTEKTDGHKNNKDKTKAEHYKVYGWKINEDNLTTLPESAPAPVRGLVRRMMLESRVRKLNEWIELYNKDTGCIHGEFNHIGTWTHRMSHQKPNMGNISAKKSIKYHSKELNKEATYLGGIFRSLWGVSPVSGKKLVSVDADGIQLRIFAHTINDKDLIQALVSGSSKDGTDAHTINWKALGPVCKTRDNAKTFLYAFFLGASINKVAEIFGCSKKEAEQAVNSFLARYPGLKKFKDKDANVSASKGFIVCIDGRPVINNEERLVLAGILQSGEAIVVKRAAVNACKKLRELGIWFRLINIVHDEIIFLLDDNKEICDNVIKIVADCIKEAGVYYKLNCPMKGNGKQGYNWLEVH